jgi:hypothetical protein
VNCADAIPEMGTSAAICVFFKHARLCEKFPERVLTEQRYRAILGKFYIDDQIVICTISTIYIAASFPTVLTVMPGIGRECGFERNACAAIPGRSICIFRVI